LRQTSFTEAITLLLNSLQQLIKGFGDKITAPIAEVLEEFMAQIPSLLRRPMLLLACIFWKSVWHRIVAPFIMVRKLSYLPDRYRLRL